MLKLDTRRTAVQIKTKKINGTVSLLRSYIHGLKEQLGNQTNLWKNCVSNERKEPRECSDAKKVLQQK